MEDILRIDISIKRKERQRDKHIKNEQVSILQTNEIIHKSAAGKTPTSALEKDKS